MGYDELRHLLEAARTSPRTIRLLSGMTPESFYLDGDTPTATVQAACTRNRREAVQPLPLVVTKALRECIDNKPAGEPVGPGKWKPRRYLMVRSDMQAARRRWLGSFRDARQRAEAEQSDFLAYCDSQGHFADFHALRHSLITMVGKTGISPKEHRDLAPHSTYALTGKYTHSRIHDLAAAVNDLPPIVAPDCLASAKPEALLATGTEGREPKTAPKTLAQT
jgi:hypothetical protein